MVCQGDATKTAVLFVKDVVVICSNRFEGAVDFRIGIEKKDHEKEVTGGCGGGSKASKVSLY